MKTLFLILFITFTSLILLACEESENTGSTDPGNSKVENNGDQDDDGSGNSDNYLDCEDDICIDPKSGLMWQNGDYCCLTQYEAEEHCKSLDWGGHDYGWDLPTISQLRSLIRGCPNTMSGGSCGVTDDCGNECLNESCYGCEDYAGPGAKGRYWPIGIKGLGWRYWSTTGANLGSFYVDFKDGKVINGAGSVEAYVRCVF